jgi:heat shock protein 5
MRNTLFEGKLKDSFSNKDKKLITETSAEGLQWLASNQDATADQIKDQQKEMESKYNPIMAKVYAEAGVMPGSYV